MSFDLFRCSMSPEAGRAVAELYTPDVNGRVYCGQGMKTEEFEQAFAKAVGLTRVPLGVNSCSAAIDLSLHMIGVGFGDEVITTPITCSATNGAIVNRGARIVWADVDPCNGLIDPSDVARKITKRTKAIIAVDWAGRSCDYKRLRAASHELAIIQDSAHRLYPTEDLGDYTCWSFGPIKALTTGGYGGALLPPRIPLGSHKRAELLRWHGLDRTGPSDSFRCVHSQSKVRLADGGRSIPISTMVAQQHPGPVLVHENGKLVPRRVIGWHRTPRNGRRFLRVAPRSMAGRQAVIVTEDHLILTKSGWKRADQLQEHDQVATAYASPSAQQRQLLIGGLLGDACINGKRSGKYRNVIAESHTARDRAYAEAKVAALAGLSMQLVEYAPDQKHPNGSVHFWSASLPALAELGQSFYPEGLKIVPRELIEQEGLSDLAMAIWYMDDGSTRLHNGIDAIHPYCQIATNGFSEDDVKWLVEYLLGIGLSCYVQKGSGWRIAFDKIGSRALVERISRFVPQSMRYKVGHLGGLDDYDDGSWGTGQSERFWDNVEVTEHIDTRYQTTYCLTVEGGANNFVAGPVVVHNCEQDIKEVGYRYHMTDDQAAVGLANLNLAMRGVKQATANAAFYADSLRNTPGITVPQWDIACDYWLFGLIVNEDRDAFMGRMAAFGVPTSRVHARTDKHTAFKLASSSGPLPGVDFFDSHQVNIPVGHWLTDDERQHVVDAVKASLVG